MRTFKSRLTRLKHLLESKLPDGPDVYGYEGITRDMLLKTCNDIYSLSQEIEKRDGAGEFEIVALKRYESKIQESLQRFLEEDAGTAKGKEKFDDFLDKFTKLYEKTKQVYFIVNKNGLRDEVEIGCLRTQIDELNVIKSQYEVLLKELSQKSDAATTRAGEIETIFGDLNRTINDYSESSKAASVAINSAHTSVKQWENEISETHDKLAGWEQNIKKTLDAIKTNEESLDIQLRQLKTGNSELITATTKSAALTTETEATHQRNIKLLAEITDTLGDANRKGMGASFKTQMEIMQKAQDQWKWVFISALIAFALISGTIVAIHLLDGASTWQSTLVRFTIVTPVIWLAWFAVRQYGFANRVREDYAYKHSTAMAFEGYKKAVREAAPDLEKTLIKVAMMNLALNPVRLYSPKDADHATPVSEWFDKIFGRVKSVKASVDPQRATAEAELKTEQD